MKGEELVPGRGGGKNEYVSDKGYADTLIRRKLGEMKSKDSIKYLNDSKERNTS